MVSPLDLLAQSSLQQVVLSAWGLHVFDTRCATRSAIVGKGAALPGLPGCTCVVHHSESASLLAGGEDGSLLCFDLRTMRERDRVAGVPTRSAASFSRIAENAAILAHSDHSGGESALTGPSYRTSIAWGHAGAVTALALGGDGQYLVSGGQDGEVRLWSVPELAFARTFPRVHEGFGVTSDTLTNPVNSWIHLAGVSGLWCAGDDVFSSGHDGAVSRTAVWF
jgi:WD40 repeat protein